VEWSKDNVPVNEDSSVYQFMQVDNKYRMKILRTGHNDIGQYAVHANGTAADGGRITAAFSVNLTFPSD